MGLIFDVRDKDNFFCGKQLNFAQSPQIVQIQDFNRVFFTSRQLDEKSGKWFSQPFFVDFNSDFSRQLTAPKLVFLEKTKLGTFDEHGIFPFSPLKVNNKIYAFSTGWSRRKSVSVETGIGLLVSHDYGESFERFGDGPILSASLHEPYLVCDGFVRFFKDKYWLWYIYGTNWLQPANQMEPERTYKITVTTSNSLFEWKTQNFGQIVPSRIGHLECQALPSVLINNDDDLEMVFCYRQTLDFRKNPQNSYKIGYAWSNDGKFWLRDDEKLNIIRSNFDSEMQCYPHLVSTISGRFLLFNGNEFGKYGFGAAKFRQ